MDDNSGGDRFLEDFPTELRRIKELLCEVP